MSVYPDRTANTMPPTACHNHPHPASAGGRLEIAGCCLVCHVRRPSATYLRSRWLELKSARDNRVVALEARCEMSEETEIDSEEEIVTTSDSSGTLYIMRERDHRTGATFEYFKIGIVNGEKEEIGRAHV